ncbi:hypothetical protein XENORESO_019754 [Xenotaenia resolanae]|uniref:Uncharacterized protein n=1 Tax=Xenotaenia resolanae TaxID=208358 RepID=A0ABV0WSI2_9TELE
MPGSIYCRSIANVNMWSLLNTTGSLTGNMCFGQNEVELFGNKHCRWMCCKTKEKYVEIHLMPNAKYSRGFVMLRGCFFSKGKNWKPSATDELKICRHWLCQKKTLLKYLE